MSVLVTGAAGFIGCHLAARLLADGHEVTGIDNFDDYYDVRLKENRIARLRESPNAGRFSFIRMDLADAPAMERLFGGNGFKYVVNLAGQAGVRHSLVNPGAYVKSNLAGFANLLECCRARRPEHLLYASSSSVYGLNAARPYSTSHNVDHPASLYAATKKSNELMAHSYSHLFGLPTTGLRFFTVYGPWGRPDMALHLFVHSILNGKPIKVFNNGALMRDFTYIDDIIEGVARLLPLPAAPDPDFDPANPNPAASSAPWRVCNIGNSQTVALEDFISVIERALGKKAIRQMLPMQPGDVESTWADVSDLERLTGFAPRTSLEDGVARYVKWHREYYGE